jgi:hypothetical protein
MLQITQKGLAVGDLKGLRDHFSREHWVLLKEFLCPELLDIVQRQLSRAKWHSHVSEDGTEFTLDDPPTLGLLLFLLNSPELLNAITIVTGCSPLDNFHGRVYRMSSGPSHHNHWHSDMIDQRRVAMSLNLGDRVFSGGALQLRARGTTTILATVANTGLGDALLFRISDELRHRVDDVVGPVAKTACAGWFRGNGSNFFAKVMGRAG